MLFFVLTKNKPISRSRSKSPNPDPKKNQLIVRNHYLNEKQNSYSELMKKTHETMNTSYQKLLENSLNISALELYKNNNLSDKIKQKGLNKSVSNIKIKKGDQMRSLSPQ